MSETPSLMSATDPAIICPRCRRTLARIEDGETVVRYRDRFRVVVREGAVECLRCRLLVPLTSLEESA